jgi:choline-sulfatase
MRIFVVLLCFCVVCGVSVSQQSPQNAANPSNIFLITIDTLRADHVHCYGYKPIQTPALDLIARDGIRFTQAFTPSPITNSSHASILTGLLPSSHGVSDFGVPLAPNHPTLAQLLATKGYHTAAFIGAVILDSRSLAPGLNRGFDFYDNFQEHPITKSRWGRLERRGMEVEQRAELWLSKHADGAHFVWAHFYDPHDPYEPPAPYSDIYKDRLYDGEIAYADSALGHFLAYLKKQGWYDGALIVVVGDHGEGLGEHHEDTHGIFLYDSTTHVPLLVKLSNGRAAGKEVNEQVRTTDIVPTILELVGLPMPEKLDGASLSPLFSGGEAMARTVFGQTDYPLRFGWAPLRSVREEGFKFIEAPKPELYDLRADSGELQNKYEPWNADVQKLRKTLAELNAPPQASGSTSPAAVSAETIDELHALGYLGQFDVGSSTNVPEPSMLPDPKDKIEEQNLVHAAMTAMESEEPGKARAALAKLLLIDDKSSMALVHLGHLELTEGNYKKAVEYLGRAHELRADETAGTLEYARALELDHDPRGAREVLQEHLKKNPHLFAAQLLLGQIYFRSGDMDAAADQLEDAALLQPENVEAKTSLAGVLVSQKKFADAVELLEPVAKTSKDDADLFSLLAQAYAGVGRRGDARRAEARAQVLRRGKK